MSIAEWYEERGRQAGFEIGLKMGTCDALLRQLRSRFGTLPEASEARVRAADTAQLDAWIDRVLTASTLDEVLGAG
jgi:uncharacterized protein DUF4351